MRRFFVIGFLGMISVGSYATEYPPPSDNTDVEYISYEQAYECDIYAALAEVIMEYKKTEAPVRSLLKVNEKFDFKMRNKLDDIVVDAYSRNETLDSPAINDNPKDFKEEYLNYCLSI